jgi:hypothetical protein
LRGATFASRIVLSERPWDPAVDRAFRAAPWAGWRWVNQRKNWKIG